MKRRGEARWRAVLNLCSNIARCGQDTEDGCGAVQPDRYTRDERDSIVNGLLRHDIGASSAVCYAPSEAAAVAQFGVVEGFATAERAAHRLITLPFHPALNVRDVELTCQTLEVMIQRQSIIR